MKVVQHCGRLSNMVLNYNEQSGVEIGVEFVAALKAAGIQILTNKYHSKKVYKIKGSSYEIKIFGKDSEVQRSCGVDVGYSGWVAFKKHPNHYWFIRSTDELVSLIRAYS